MSRIHVDRDLCEGLGMCQAMAPDFFELDDDDQMHVLQEVPPADQLATVSAAVSSCPVLALSLQD